MSDPDRRIRPDDMDGRQFIHPHDQAIWALTEIPEDTRRMLIGWARMGRQRSDSADT